METTINSQEVITNTLTPCNLPNIPEIKKEICDEDLASRIDNYDDFDFEPFHEHIFRTLSAHFSTKSNMNEIDDACLKLENCFIENNILDKHGLTKSSLKGTANSCVFLKCRDIDDAFVDMVISESVSKSDKNNKCTAKKIDLKRFKDNFFSFDFNDCEDVQSQGSDSDSEVIGECESFNEPSQSEADVHDGSNSDIESSLTEDTDILDSVTNVGNPCHVRLTQLSNNITKVTDSDLSPLKNTVRDIRVIVEKLPSNLSDRNSVEVNSALEKISSKSYGTKIRQVARKKTGGMVINTNISECNDIEADKEEKSNQTSKEDNLGPDGFDKMTRSDRRKLEKIIAESRASLGSTLNELHLDHKSYENQSNITSPVKDFDGHSVEKASNSTSDERKTPSTSNERESANNSSCDKESNEKEVDAVSNEDKSNENELLKSVVTNTILDFLIKSKGLKLGKEKIDLISDEITKKLNSVIPDEDGTDADDSESMNTGMSFADNKVENNTPSVSENCEENTSKKKQNPPKKKTTKRSTSSAGTNKRLQEFQEIARDIINCKLSAPLVDEVEVPSKPNTRQSLSKSDKETPNDVTEEPRRPITRQSLAKNEKDKILDIDEQEEPRKPTTRQSIAKLSADVIIDAQEEPRRPVTRQSLTKNDKVSLPNELPKETKRQSNTATAKNDKDIISDRMEEVKRPTSRQSSKDSDSVIVPDETVDEEPRRPATRQFLAKNDKDIIIIDLEKEEPKKHTTRKTVAELERSMSLGPNLTVDCEIDEPKRRTTRQSSQKQKEISKGSSESSILTNELKPEIAAPRRKNNSRTKKNSAKKIVKNQRGNSKKIEVEDISRDNSVDGPDIDDDSIISLSDSDTSKSSQSHNSFFSGRTILKASADSTTIETELNEETKLTDDRQLHSSTLSADNEPIAVKSTEKDSSLPLNTNITYNKSSTLITIEKNAAQSKSEKNSSVDDVCLPDTSISVSSFSNIGNSEVGSDISDDNLKNVSKLVEDVLDESMKDKLSQNQETFGGSPYKKSFSTIPHPSKDKVPQPVDEPFQILNDMITDIEERLLKEETEAIKCRSDNEINKDVNKSPISDKDIFNSPSVTVEISADSTSFLNYTMDDSFKLMIDESTPQKEIITKETDVESKENEENSSKKFNAETTCSSEVSGLKEDLDKQSFIVKDVEKPHSKVSCLKEISNEAGESKEEVGNSHSSVSVLKESEPSIKVVEMNDSEESSLKKDVHNEPITQSRKDVDMLPREDLMTDKPESIKSTDQRTNDKDIPSSSAIEQKLSNSSKPLTIEEKIAQITKRDPRLINDKKIPNVALRDPRLRNKIQKNDGKSENISDAQNITDCKPSEQKVKLPEKLDSKIHEKKVVIVEPLRVELNPSKSTEEKKKMSDQKLPVEKSSESKVITPTISETKSSNCLPEVETDSLLRDLGGATSQETDSKQSFPSEKSSTTNTLEDNYDQNRKRRHKKTVDEELLYKTPLSDLHEETHLERSTYEKEKDFKKKKLFPEGRTVRIVTEERTRTMSIPRRITTVVASHERRDNQSIVAANPPGFWRRESQEESNFRRPNLEVPNLRADHRYSEEIRFRKENLTYEEKTYYQEKKEILPSGSNENYEQGSYVRRLVTETSYSQTFHSKNDFQDNHIYSRREFYRRNRYAHDHDHLGHSSRFLENSSNMQNENEIYPQRNNVTEPTLGMWGTPPVSYLPEPMYSQEEELDQSYGNMETDSFSPPPTDLCPPPPPLIRSPTPELGRRDNYCPSPPRIGRRDFTDERDHEEFSRAYNRNYENDRSFRGRSNNSGGKNGGHFRRGNGREYHRWREESPPRKRFAVENFRGREDERSRWRRSPSWSPERSRRTRPGERSSPPPRGPHPWKSPPRGAHLWDSPPPHREPHPWNSPPRYRSPSPPRRRDNYRDRSSHYYRH